MYKPGIKLLHSDGSFNCYITDSQLRTEIRKGNVKRANAWKKSCQVYQKVIHAAPSETKNSKPMITRNDLLKLIGMQRLAKNREDIDLERLIGFGLIAENTPIPANGYL